MSETIVDEVAERARPRGGWLFLVWGPPSHGPRSRIFAEQLGIDLEHVHLVRRRGLAAAPAKYSYQAFATLRLLARRRPSVVFVQSPPSLAVLVVALFGAVTGARYVVDAHSDAMLSPWWTRPRWLHRLLTRRAVTTIVTNDHFAGIIRGSGGAAVVLPDIPTTHEAARVDLGADHHVTFVSTFAADEPLAEVLIAAAARPDVRFHVTGDPRRAPAGLVDTAPPNVRFTGFLPDEEFYGLLAASDAVMCLTTRDHTMQCGACEALSLGTPIITSDWPVLRRYFHQGTVHVDNTAAGIRAGVDEMLRGHAGYRRGIVALQIEQQRAWEAARRDLLHQLGAADG